MDIASTRMSFFMGGLMGWGCTRVGLAQYAGRIEPGRRPAGGRRRPQSLLHGIRALQRPIEIEGLKASGPVVERLPIRLRSLGSRAQHRTCRADGVEFEPAEPGSARSLLAAVDAYLVLHALPRAYVSRMRVDQLVHDGTPQGGERTPDFTMSMDSPDVVWQCTPHITTSRLARGPRVVPSPPT